MDVKVWIPTFQMYYLAYYSLKRFGVGSKKSIDHGYRYQLIVRSKPTVQLRITIKVAMYGRFYKIEDFLLQADKKSAITLITAKISLFLSYPVHNF